MFFIEMFMVGVIVGMAEHQFNWLWIGLAAIFLSALSWIDGHYQGWKGK